MFKSKDEILNLLERAYIINNSVPLISEIDNIKKHRKDFFLTREELESILVWKLRTQYERQQKIRTKNSDENIELITKTAFSIKHIDKKVECTLKLKTLTLLFGVEIPVASAILAICFPNDYAVIDSRNWRQVYKTERQKTTYSTQEYIDYLKIIKQWAEEFDFTPQEIDIAIWQKDYEIELDRKQKTTA